MISSIPPISRLVITVCLLALLTPQPAQAQTYTITTLPPLAGDTYSAAYALNEAGQAAGLSGSRAVIWTDGMPKNIQTIGTSSVALALNDFGHVVGDVWPAASGSNGFYWNGITMQRIIPPTGQSIVEAFAMNNSGTVVGRGGTTNAWRWTAGAFASLNFLPGDQRAFSFAINNLGVAVGRSFGPVGSRPVIWTSTALELVPLPDDVTRGTAWGINDLGLVVGEYFAAGATWPFAWSSGTDAIALPLPPGAVRGFAWAANNAGDIIGEADEQPVLWRKNAAGQYEAILLTEHLSNAAGWTKMELWAINEVGQIVGPGAEW